MIVSAALVSLCLSGAALAPPPAKTITVLVGHHFSRSDAHVRVQQLLDYWDSRARLIQKWTGDRVAVSGTVIGVTFSAILDITDGVVRCESTDPGFVVRNTARDYVQKKLRKYLNPQYAEQ